MTLVDTESQVTPQAVGSLSWQPLDYLDNSNANSLDGTHNKRENSRAFSTHITAVILQNRTLMNYSTTELAKNDALKQINSSISMLSETASKRPEIKEPILILSPKSHTMPRETSATRSTKIVLANTSATSYSDLHGKAEISEPALNPKTSTTTPYPKMVKPREISNMFSGIYHEHNNKWTPALNLNPPPIGDGETWQHWATETTASKSVSMILETPLLDDKSYDTLAPLNETNSESRRLEILPPTKNSKESHSSPVTIQFFPERLAAILAQAERYARLTFSFPMAAISKLGYYYKSHISDSLEGDQVTSASSNRLYNINTQVLSGSSEDSNRRSPSLQTQRKPKYFTTVRPTVGNVNTKPSSQNTSSTIKKLKLNNGKTISSSVTTEVTYSRHISKEVPYFQPRVNFFGKTTQMKDTTQSMLIFVPYSYTYVSDDEQIAAEDSEMPRYIPLLRHPYTNHKGKYETQQSYNKSNNKGNQNSSEKSAVHVSNKELSDGRNSDTDYKKYFSNFHSYLVIPER